MMAYAQTCIAYAAVPYLQVGTRVRRTPYAQGVDVEVERESHGDQGGTKCFSGSAKSHDWFITRWQVHHPPARESVSCRGACPSRDQVHDG